jgi:hypothetical protein
VNAFFYGIFLFYFEPFSEEVIIDVSLDSDAFVAFFGRSVPLLFLVSGRTFI